MDNPLDLPDTLGGDVPSEAELEYFLEENHALQLENDALRQFAEVVGIPPMATRRDRAPR